MEAIIDNKEVEPSLLQVANMNYGQKQRWQDFVPLKYELKIDIDTFTNRIDEYFTLFRRDEIEDDDVEDFPELAAYKEIGRPDLAALILDHPLVLEDLLKFNDYDIIHRVVVHPKPVSNYYYSINSLDSVNVKGKVIILKGICFQSDYIEHTYSHELSRKYALLK